MALQIEAPNTIQLSEELSRCTGITAEDVVESTLREQFDRLQDMEAEAQQRAEIYALVRALQTLVKESPGAIQNPGESLYGEDGLPN